MHLTTCLPCSTIFRLARVLYPHPVRRPYTLKCIAGNVVAVIATLNHKPTLGVLLDEQHRPQNSNRYDVFRHTLYRIPTSTERPSLKFLDEHTPFLFLGGPLDTPLDFRIKLFLHMSLLQRARSADPLLMKVLPTVLAMSSSSSPKRTHIYPTTRGLPRSTQRISGMSAISESGLVYHWTRAAVSMENVTS